MRYFPILCILLITTLILPFGKNKVQHHDFDWKFIETDHFRIYFYQGGEHLADFTADMAEKSLERLRKDLMYVPKSKIHVIVYNSHNHFEETNVMGGIPEESVGGFTEFFKNRVVVPYEGNWEGFRHVIHHELTHAIMNQMLFQGNYQSIVSGLTNMNMPLWFIEGIAEYESRGGWDSESDQTVRDAVYHNYIGNVYYLNNYMAYKGGQSLFKYIADTYGSKKIGEILRAINMIRSTEDAFLDALGTNFEDLSQNWDKWLKTKYWDTLIQTDEPKSVAVMLSDHEEYGNSINNSPVISPDGKKIVFLSNKSDYFDIYLMRTFDGQIVRKIVSGQSSGDFEEFHWLRPGFAWSPDSRNIAFFTKSTDEDALFIYEAETGKRLKRVKFGLDGLYYPEWSKDGDHICFTGVKDGFSDIYLYTIGTGELKKLTDDIYSDNEPRFSPDGTKIAFSSDRLEDLTIDKKSLSNVMQRDLNVKDIFVLDIASDTITPVTDSGSFRKFSPFWIDDGRLGYISDESGISNIYYKDLVSGQSSGLTNLMTGCSQASYSDNKIAFTAVFKAGYDIFMINDVEKLIEERKEPLQVRWYEETDFSKVQAESDSTFEFAKTDLRKFMFRKDLLYDKPAKVITEEERVLLRQPKPYEIHFTPDIITVNAGYATGYGVVGSTFLQFSDYLSDHRFIIATDLNQDILNSNLGMYYFYLKNRTNIGMGISHEVVYYYIWDEIETEVDDWYRDRLLGIHFTAQYPFSRFSRIDSSFDITSIVNEKWYDPADKYEHDHTNTLFTTGAGYSYDNVIWGYYGPENGTRMRFDAVYGSETDDLTLKEESTGYFSTFAMDYRKYFRLKGEYQFAIRLSGALSEGSTPQSFYLGGFSNWLNYKYNDDYDYETFIDKYYSSRVYPMRGYRLLEQSGNRYALVNAEFRYPFVRYMVLGFPFPMILGKIDGVLFTDAGSAWNNSDFRGTVKPEGEDRRLKDIIFSSGIGTRMNAGYFILRYDVSWTWDFNSASSAPIHIFSLGTNF
ncbi:MAG: peptidase MA family metallohydrolase [Candidatus Delongbacteria bacterium]|nr:peptidase MA family metallohydrolase [Candidatus Delongbacteria bacterium]